MTWKVDDDVYQNIDVLELDKESEYSLGRVLRIEGMGSYSDLDELIVNHVKPMVHMVEMMRTTKSTRALTRRTCNAT